jgi:hypothetical protein
LGIPSEVRLLLLMCCWLALACLSLTLPTAPNPPERTCLRAADNAARLYGALRQTPWREHLKLVILTPHGLGMSTFDYQLYQPLTSFKLETWADFTSRLRPVRIVACHGM